MTDPNLLRAATIGAATLTAIYEWVLRIDKAGGTTTISGIAAATGMLNSLRKEAPRMEKLVFAPLREAIAATDKVAPSADEVVKLRRDAAAWKTLCTLAGYVEDGSNDTVKLWQDDATRSWFVKVGKRFWYASSPEGALVEAQTYLDTERTP